MKILIPGAGGKIFHIRNFRDIPEVERVVITEADPWVYGNFVADAAYLLPRFSDPGFFNAFDALYDKEKFDVCIPINDASLMLFSDNRARFQSYPFILAINEKEAIDVLADKRATYEFFVRHDMPTARIYTVDEFAGLAEYRYPYFVKPRYINLRGTSRQLFMKLEDAADVEYMARKIKGGEKDFVIQDYLEGTEINIDFFCEAGGEVKSIVPLKRLGMGMSRGITRGEIVFDERFDEYVKTTARSLKLWGANNMQVYVDDAGTFTFTEINGRFSGSSVFVKEAGVNFFHYFVKLLRNEPIAIPEKPRYLRMSSWEQHFFFTETKVREL